MKVYIFVIVFYFKFRVLKKGINIDTLVTKKHTKNIFSRIFKLFTSNGLKIKNINSLKKYINFCLENRVTYTKHRTALHHILPQGSRLPFSDYKNLKDNSWNGAMLSHRDHFKAHYMLAEAIDHFSIYNAFFFMHSTYIKPDELSIAADKYDEIMTFRKSSMKELYTTEERTKINKQISYTKNKEFIKDDKITTSAKESGFNSGITRNKEFIKDDKITTINKEINKMAVLTKNKEFIKDGKITTIYKESGAKTKKTRSKKIVKDGLVTNEYIETAKKRALKEKENGNLYRIIKWGEVLYKGIPQRTIHNLSQSLVKGNVIGSNYQSKASAIRLNKEYLIGVCVEKHNNDDFNDVNISIIEDFLRSN